MTTALSLPPRADVRPRPPSAPAAGSIRPRRIALLIADLRGGGVQKMTLALARGLAAEGHQVELVLFGSTREAQIVIPPGIDLHVLQRSSSLSARVRPVLADPAGLPRMLLPVILAWKPLRSIEFLAALAGYLKARRPEALIAAAPNANLLALWAKRLAGSGTRVLISERSAPSQMLAKSAKWRSRFLPGLMRRTYPRADVIVAVSADLAEDLATVTRLPRGLIRTIYNPVVGPDLADAAARSLDHPWFAPGEPPVLLGIGRLSEQKDFPTLVRAFAAVRASRPARLLILGATVSPEKTAKRQEQLLALAKKLGVAADVGLPGFVANPFAYMARAGAFVLSSRYEGLPGVLIQALACGCPVVSTDCPTGPREILEDGRYGPLVPVGDPDALAEAIAAVLAAPMARDALRRRARDFSSERAVSAYLTALFPDDETRTAAAAEGGLSTALV